MSAPSTAVLMACLLACGQAIAQQPSAEKAVVVTGIAGIVASNAEWETVWSGTDNADGLVPAPDGGILFAQEQPSRIRKLDVEGRDSIFLENTGGAGSLSIDVQGRLLAVQRTCTDPGRRDGECREPTRVAVLAPAYRVLADRFADGAPLGRLNDLAADAKGGAYFTVNGVHYVDRQGKVVTLAADIRSNGVILSPDEKTLYVTDQDAVVAFDVQADGSATNRRLFARLAGDTGGDGMAVDAVGRVYVTANSGVHVLSPQGEHLGVIPTPRRPISVAFAGPDKRSLYIVGSGAAGPDGEEYAPPRGARNNAKTIYRIAMLVEGFRERPK